MPKLRRIFAATLGMLVGTSVLTTLGYTLLFNQADGRDAIVNLTSDYLASIHATPSFDRSFMALLAEEHWSK